MECQQVVHVATMISKYLTSPTSKLSILSAQSSIPLSCHDFKELLHHPGHMCTCYCHILAPAQVLVHQPDADGRQLRRLLLRPQRDQHLQAERAGHHDACELHHGRAVLGGPHHLRLGPHERAPLREHDLHRRRHPGVALHASCCILSCILQCKTVFIYAKGA